MVTIKIPAGFYRPGMFGPVDFARTQITDQQLILAEYIQGQIAVVVIVTMKNLAANPERSPLMRSYGYASRAIAQPCLPNFPWYSFPSCNMQANFLALLPLPVSVVFCRSPQCAECLLFLFLVGLRIFIANSQTSPGIRHSSYLPVFTAWF
jgi:hypothetical protein